MRRNDLSFVYRHAGGPAAGFAGVTATRVRRGAGAWLALPMTRIPAALTQVKAWDNASHAGKGITPRPLVLQGGTG